MTEFWDLHRYPYWSYDTETTGLVYPISRVFGFSVATPDGKAGYWDIRKDPQAWDWLQDEIDQTKGRIISHNASFDYRMSLATGLRIPLELLDDTVIRACLIDEHQMSYELDHLGKVWLRMRKVKSIYEELAELFGGRATRNVQMKNLQYAPPDKVAPYATEDAILCLKLWEYEEQEIAAEDQQKYPLRSIVDFERSLMPTIIRREVHGVRVDVDAAERAAERLVPIIAKEKKKLDEIAGWEINVNSSPQIKKLFAPEYREGEWWVGPDMVGTTGSGGPSLASPYLRELSHPAAGLIRSVRSLIKTRDTFLLGHVCGHAFNGRVYPNINQSKGEDGGTGTGRFSYTNPALGQIPSRDKSIAQIIKEAFLPDEDHVWVSTDLHSFEVRIFAHLINNLQIIEQYSQNPRTDFHQFVADLTGLPRDAEYPGQPYAKQLNLSMIFNSGKGAIADKMGMPWRWETFTIDGGPEDGKKVTYKKAGPEAEEVIARYHRRIPGVHELAEGCKRRALSRGYVRTFAGRRLRFPKGFKAYKASGLLIQATSADINKENWQRIEDALGKDGHMILNTHDSYELSIEKGKEKRATGRVRKAIEEEGRVRVPLILDINGTGENWWDAIDNSN